MKFLTTRLGMLGAVVTLSLCAPRFPASGEPAPADPVLAALHDPRGDTVLRFLERRVADDPDDHVAWNRLGAELLRRLRATGELSLLGRAEEAARRSLAAVPAARNPGGLLVRARVEHADHRFLDAVATGQELARLAPGQASTWETLGDARLEAGDLPAAGEAFGELARLTAGESRPEVEVRLARLALARGERPAARAGFDRALAAAGTPEAADTAAFAQVQLGRMDFEEGELSGAEAHYRTAFALAPAGAAAFVNLAELAAARGEEDRAKRLYGQLIERVPRPEFCHELADFLIFTGKTEEARPWAERALAGYLESVARGEHCYFHHLAAFLSDTREDPGEALKWAQRDAEQRHGPAARDAVAWALYRGGDFAGAAAEMDRALTTAGPAANPHLLGHAGLIFLQSGDAERAVSCQRRAQALNPNLNRFHAHR